MVRRQDATKGYEKLQEKRGESVSQTKGEALAILAALHLRREKGSSVAAVQAESDTSVR